MIEVRLAARHLAGLQHQRLELRKRRLREGEIARVHPQLLQVRKHRCVAAELSRGGPREHLFLFIRDERERPKRGPNASGSERRRERRQPVFMRRRTRHLELAEKTRRGQLQRRLEQLHHVEPPRSSSRVASTRNDSRKPRRHWGFKPSAKGSQTTQQLNSQPRRGAPALPPSASRLTPEARSTLRGDCPETAASPRTRGTARRDRRRVQSRARVLRCAARARAKPATPAVASTPQRDHRVRGRRRRAAAVRLGAPRPRARPGACSPSPPWPFAPGLSIRPRPPLGEPLRMAR